MCIHSMSITSRSGSTSLVMNVGIPMSAKHMSTALLYISHMSFPTTRTRTSLWNGIPSQSVDCSPRSQTRKHSHQQCVQLNKTTFFYRIYNQHHFQLILLALLYSQSHQLSNIESKINVNLKSILINILKRVIILSLSALIFIFIFLESLFLALKDIIIPPFSYRDSIFTL